jgi:hypothetical protein
MNYISAMYAEAVENAWKKGYSVTSRVVYQMYRSSTNFDGYEKRYCNRCEIGRYEGNNDENRN